MLGFIDTYNSYASGRLTCDEAGTLLGMSERSFRRWKMRYEADGEAGLADKRVGKVSSRRAQDFETKLVNRLYAEQYRGFNISHYHQFLVEHHGLNRSYDFVKCTLAASRLVRPHKRGGDHRLRRPRKPMVGMMLHQDASTHPWFGEENCDLVVTLDDATSENTSAFLPYIGRDLNEVLCVQETRIVGLDNTVRYDGKILHSKSTSGICFLLNTKSRMRILFQKDEHRHHYAKCEVIVHQKLDETLAIFYGNRCLEKFDKNGKPLAKNKLKKCG